MAPQIPLVDLTPFTTPSSAAARSAAAVDLASKVRVNGCVGVTGHGISSAHLNAAFDIVKALFALPYEQKMRAPHPEAPVPHRGYSGTGREKGAAKTALETDDAGEKERLARLTDYKESYEIGHEEGEQGNIWLPDDALSGFRAFMIEFYAQLTHTADAVLEALILGLELKDDEAEAVRALHTGRDNQLRLLHYPPLEKEMQENENLSRLGAHKDWSTFTILFQQENGGLEFVDGETGEFMPAEPKDGVLYLNIGDMFQRISNDFYPSALHRVVIPKARDGESTPARYSIPYFVAPSANGTVEPQGSRVELDGKRAYEPITFMKYSEMMFKAVNVYG